MYICKLHDDSGSGANMVHSTLGAVSAPACSQPPADVERMYNLLKVQLVLRPAVNCHVVEMKLGAEEVCPFDAGSEEVFRPT